MNVQIRSENPSDYTGIKNVNDLAFSQTNEGILVEKLRVNPDFVEQLSLVAVRGGEIVGHILFPPIWIDDGIIKRRTLALAPMSVLPDYQKKGIGSQLVNKGLKICRRLGYKSVIVLGHPAYYSKFRFVEASLFGINSPFDVPEEVFMGMELVPDGLKDITGIVQYSKEFNEV